MLGDDGELMWRGAKAAALKAFINSTTRIKIDGVVRSCRKLNPDEYILSGDVDADGKSVSKWHGNEVISRDVYRPFMAYHGVHREVQYLTRQELEMFTAFLMLEIAGELQSVVSIKPVNDGLAELQAFEIVTEETYEDDNE